MRAELHSRALEEYAGRFVWLELNIDRSENASFLAAHEVGGLPILYIFDTQGKARATWAGSATREQLARFLDQGERAALGARAPAPDAAMRRGDELLARQRLRAAAREYREAARRGGRSWKGHPAAIDAAAVSLQLAGQHRECAALAAREAPRLPRTRPFVTVTTTGLWCANVGADAPWARQLRPVLEQLAREALAQPSGMVDDRGMLYHGIHRARELAGDASGARKAATEWLASIEAEDRADPTPPRDERAMRDGCRLQAARLLGEPARALPALEASARLAPDDYSTAMRLAWAYEAAGRDDEALASVARALALSPGPEARARLLIVRATALARRGDHAGGAKALDEALAAARQIASRSTRDTVGKHIEELRAKAKR